MPVPVRDLQAVRLAATRFSSEGRKDAAIIEQLGMKPSVFYRRVSWLIDRQDVEAVLPLEVHRLRRLRESRKRHRSGMRAGWSA